MKESGHISRLFCPAILVLVACGNESTAPPMPPASVEVSPAVAGIVMGQTLQLTGRSKTQPATSSRTAP